jgi:hypothetical protein
MRKRAQAALEVLKKNPQVNPLQTAAPSSNDCKDASRTP